MTDEKRLKRELGLTGAVMMGLGAMLGTGVFVSIGIAAGIAGPSVILATALAAVVAVCNGLSSAQLAATHPVSGGTYEYGYHYLNSWLGFTAGWLFLLAKSASAATAALGFSGYLLYNLQLPEIYRIPLALIAVALFIAVVMSGMKRSNIANTVIVSVTLFALVMFISRGLPAITAKHFEHWFPATGVQHLSAFFEASALMFVAYTGYGRIATLGEEVQKPETTIPKAIIFTMVITMVLYIGVALVSIGVAGAQVLQQATAQANAPLTVVAQAMGTPITAKILAVGAITAMLGVLLNLVMGLSRVLLAMGRRGDVPAFFAHLNRTATTPTWATLGVGVLIGGLVLIGDIKTTWSFSAFTVLIYYAITNLAALRLPTQYRLYPRWIALLGLASCLFLAFWVDIETWVAGLALIAAGLVWHGLVRGE